MNLPPQHELSHVEERQLNQWLCAAVMPEGTFNLDQLKGFLFCICTTPVLISPAAWLPEVFAGTMPELTDVSLESGISLIMQLYNQINQEVIDGTSTSPTIHCPLDTHQLHNNFKPGNQLHDWCYGFDLGLQITMCYWENQPISGTDLEEVIENFWVALCFFANEKHTRKCLGQGGKKLGVFADMTQTLHQNLPVIINEYGAICRELYLSTPQEIQMSTNAIGYMNNADELIEAAHDAENPEEAIHLAKLALDEDPDCVDAFILLAELDAHNTQERISFLELAVQAGEKALGPELLQEHNGELWMLYEARPFLHALHFLADTYRSSGKVKEALTAYERCLSLNINDNQGIRHTLIGFYIEQQNISKAAELLDSYAEDSSAFMLYSRVLLHYMQEGDSENSRKLKAAAVEYNHYIPKLLGGRIKMPKKIPEQYAVGDKNEAVVYVNENHTIWRSVLGSITWLNKYKLTDC